MVLRSRYLHNDLFGSCNESVATVGPLRYKPFTRRYHIAINIRRIDCRLYQNWVELMLSIFQKKVSCWLIGRFSASFCENAFVNRLSKAEYEANSLIILREICARVCTQVEALKVWIVVECAVPAPFADIAGWRI